MRHRSALVIVVGLILVSGPLRSDTIYLRNGRTVEGVVQRQDRTRMWVRSGGRTVEIQKSDVRRVVYGDEAAKAAEERRRREAEERRKREEAERREAEQKKAEASKKEEAARRAQESKRAEEERRRRETFFSGRHDLTVGAGSWRGTLKSFHGEGSRTFEEQRTVLGSPFLNFYSDDLRASGSLFTLGYRYRRYLLEAEGQRLEREPTFLGIERDPEGSSATTTLRIGQSTRGRRDQGSFLLGWTALRWEGLELAALAGGHALYQRDTYQAFGIRRTVNLADGNVTTLLVYDAEDSSRGRMYGPEAGVRLTYTLWDRLDLGLRLSAHRLHGELVLTQSTVHFGQFAAGLFARQNTLRVSAPMRVRGHAALLSAGYRLPLGLSLFVEGRWSGRSAEFRQTTVSFPISSEVGPRQLFISDLFLKSLIVGQQIKDREKGLAFGLRKMFDFSK